VRTMTLLQAPGTESALLSLSFHFVQFEFESAPT